MIATMDECTPPWAGPLKPSDADRARRLRAEADRIEGRQVPDEGSQDGSQDAAGGAASRETANSSLQRGCSLPAASDPNRQLDGKLVPGARLNPAGRPKGRSITQAARALLGATPDEWLGGAASDAMRRAFAQSLGVDESDIPAGVSIGELMVTMLAARGAAGSVEHWRELGDRFDPKPQRVTVDAHVTAGRAPAGPSASEDEREAAESFYGALGDG